MNQELIKSIKDHYHIQGHLRSIKTISGYPHIRILSFDKDYFIKKVNKIHCQDINTLYHYLSRSDYVELPIKTINNEYGLQFKNELFLLYPILEEVKDEIPAFWWAKTLESIHNIAVNPSDFNLQYDMDKECFELLKQANELFSDGIKEHINILLDNYYDTSKSKEIVLSHGDPNDSNVMRYKTQFLLIDTEGTLLLPREYDIQRLFCNEVNKENNFDEIDKYINLFFDNYPNHLDMKLFKKIYVMDLLRTFSWLNLVIQDSSRIDYNRQIIELEKYKESILSAKHNKVLRKL